MKDPEVGIALGAAFCAVVIAMLVSFTGMVSDRMRYQAFLQAQANVLSCRADNNTQPDKLCGPVPAWSDFKPD